MQTLILRPAGHAICKRHFGFGVAGGRVGASFDRQLTQKLNLTLGLHLGVAFSGFPGSDTKPNAAQAGLGIRAGQEVDRFAHLEGQQGSALEPGPQFIEERRQAVQQWTLLDDCEDGRDVEWRLWSRDRDWAWPGPDETFFTDDEGVPSHEEVECLVGERICFGAEAGEQQWGVGVDGTAHCDSCCFICSEQPVELGGLTCE